VSLDEIVEQFRLERLTPELIQKECKRIRMVHVAESLSEVLSQTEHGGVLITAKADMCILPAAVLKQAVAVVFPLGFDPMQKWCKKLGDLPAILGPKQGKPDFEERDNHTGKGSKL